MFLNIRISTLLLLSAAALLALSALVFGVRQGVRALAERQELRKSLDTAEETGNAEEAGASEGEELLLSSDPAVPAESAKPVPVPNPPLVTFVDGEAEARSGDREDWYFLEAGDLLETGSVIRTGRGSSVDLLLWEGAVLRLTEDTVFALSELSRQSVQLDLSQGQVISRIKRLGGTQDVQFRSPSAVAGIRGTELVVQDDGGASRVYTMAGLVAVTTAQDFPAVLLERHYKTTVPQGGGPSAAVAMSPAEIARFRQLLDSLHEKQVLLVSSSITFEANSAFLTEQSKVELQGIYPLLSRREENIEIIGHTADVGDRSAQISLSALRAEAVMDYLIELGLPAGRLSALGVGSDRPAAEGSSPEAMQQDRRVEFVLNSAPRGQ